jgi:hypothetical protein
LNEKKRCFEGITVEDMKAWRDLFTAVNLDKELKACAEWAMSTPRQNYRKSILTWLRNCQKNHTTAYEPEQKKANEYTEEDFGKNKTMAHIWEREYLSKRIQNYDVQAKPSNILFIFPNNQFESIEYAMPKEEFIKKCQTPMQRLKIN